MEKRSYSSSIGAGFKSVFAGKGRRYFELIHKTNSAYHRAGSVQKIIVDGIEIGRSSKCQVRYDDAFITVSRRHAAIVKVGEGRWKLIHLSKTNPTYVNGIPVNSSCYLQNGDEIRLSHRGPVLGFVIPEGREGLTRSIGLTQRLNLFSKQALRPYWTAIGILAAVVVALCVAGAILLHRSNTRMMDAQTAIAELKAQLADEKEQSRQALAELSDMKQTLSDQKSRVGSAVSGRSSSGLRGYSLSGRAQTPAHPMNSAIDALAHGVYFIYTEGFDIRTPDGQSMYLECGEDDVPAWTGTGFLLTDGCFVTARHVVDAWSYWHSNNKVNDELYIFNLIMNNGGRVIAHFVAAASTGESFRFTSDQMQFDNSSDIHELNRDGNKVSLADYSIPRLDYAYMMTGRSGPIVADPYLSRHLERLTELTILGFPLGIGASSRKVSPVYGNATVAVSGLQDGGILTTNTNYEHGNSGGPALARDNSGKLVVVGIVSMSVGDNMGFIVPISEVCW